MKRLVAFILSLFLLAALIPASTVAQAETVGIRPFCMVNWSGSASDFSGFDYCYPMPYFYTSRSSVTKDSESIKVSVSLYNASDPKVIARKMKEDFNSRPEGARYFNLNTLTDTFYATVVDVVDFTIGVKLIRNWLENFLAEYYAIGGKLDGIAVDLEYNRATSFYIEDKQYGSAASDSAQNKNIYNEIVANPVYKTRIRPKLVERGFEFWPANKIGGYKSEIWSMYRYSGDYYAKDRNIWDAVMSEVLAEYINEAALEPLLKYYPNATLSDYHRSDTYSWLKGVGDKGGVVTTNTVKAGNTSNYNFYDFRPGTAYFDYETDTDTGLKKRTVYKTPPSFNDAVYENTPFSGAMWDVNLHKRLLASTDTGLINTWITFMNYGKRYSQTPYYAETIYHAGMMDPKPFLGYVIKNEVTNKGKNDPDPNVGKYSYNVQVIDELMAELTRVAGAADRKPILLPINWNGSYMLTGMYAGGRNIWRITPDTTKVSTEDFKVAGSVPTFSVDGLTIIFPQGKIIQDSTITKVGTCGYWVETPKDVIPVITGTADRYKENPSFVETFDAYKTGAFTSASVYPDTYWNVSGTAEILTKNGGKAVALSGNTSLNNVFVPRNITAGDEYAKQQAWEVTFTLPSGNYGDVKLLACFSADDGLKISGGKAYYGSANGFVQINGVALSAGTYTLKREVDFRTNNTLKTSYSIYNAEGKQLGGVTNVKMKTVSLPVSTISISTANTTNAVVFDNYKLYPVGVNTHFELFDAKYGKELSNISVTRTEDTAYRLSWLNGSDEHKIARIYNNKTGETVETVQMAPGMDGVATGVVKASTSKSVVLSVEIISETPDTPVVPQPTQPTPTTPKPTEPTPTVPRPTEPTTTVPKPTEPTSTAPRPSQPVPTVPKPTEPTPTVPKDDPWGEPTEEPEDDFWDEPTEEPEDDFRDEPTEEPEDDFRDEPTEEPEDDFWDEPTEEPNDDFGEDPIEDPENDFSEDPEEEFDDGFQEDSMQNPQEDFPEGTIPNDQGTTDTQQPSETQANTEPVTGEIPGQPDPGTNGKKNSGGWIALSVILGVLILGGGFAAYWFAIKPKGFAAVLKKLKKLFFYIDE